VYQTIFSTLIMSSEKFSSENKITTSHKFENLRSQEDLDAAQHSPLYPSLSRIGYVPDE
jgi:hypothetical protein